MKLWFLFVIGAFLCWGAYGPTLHAGQQALGQAPSSALRAFFWVGVAYFLLAVLGPIGLIAARGDSVMGLSPSASGPGEPRGEQTVESGRAGIPARPSGIGLALLAGSFGALGALCIILSFMHGGIPRYVMPLVFAGAPIVNVLITMALHPPKASPSPMLCLGFVLAAAGAALVLYFKPQ
ncbi:MAG: hypothetical protein HYU36_00785 [Planctomycetes bacterium]|nr:hypothetical protein [Planctomycetota bacterium]